ncbi:MAG: serpin family protein [Longimicrobiales bacterium]
MYRFRASVPTLLFAVLALMTGCNGEPTGPPEAITELPRPLTTAEEAVIEGSNLFALELLREVRAASDSPNVFLSPLSASMALGMTLNGAAENTWAQMRDVLGFAGLEEPAINESYRDLIALLLELDPQVTFGLGNSVWAREGIPFHDAFYDRVTTYFDAEAREVDFSDPAAKDAINAWVDDVTNGRITEMVQEIPPEMIMYLINAIYFNGDWREQFDPARTSAAPFERADGSTVSVPLMSINTDFRSFRTQAAMGVELPYGGDAFTAVAVLPADPERGIAEVVAELDAATWAEWMAALDEADAREVVVQLPRFELEYERTLNDDLTALGMTDAFSELQADFTRLTPVDLPAGEGPPWVFISEVKQKTFLKVDEEGTEAAAATSVGIGLTSAPPSYRFDRPFLFAIRERLSGTILFIGVIGDPS